MKNRRRKRKRITPQQRPVVSKAIDTVTLPFIHNLLCVTLPKGVFRNLEHYITFVYKITESECLPHRYGTFHPHADEPNRVAINVKSDPHLHNEQFCFYSRTPGAVKGPADISPENAVAELIPETSTAFTKEHINSPEMKMLNILTVDQIQRLWKKLVYKIIVIDTRKKGKQICFKGDIDFSPIPPEIAYTPKTSASKP